ncbi:MAG TPA: hypothetical protein VF110_09575, partial [Burkholderiales bacterium]
CAAWTVVAGKDVNWDLLNYHYYLPYELLGGRLAQDFFAAAGQSYLNPVGYLPFYLMVSAGWHSVAASIILALAHSLALPLLYLIARRLFAHLPARERTVHAVLGTALGAATSVWWTTVGSSFLDPLLVPPMLAGLLLLMDGGARPATRAAVAGALFGAAAALKYSNALFAIAALPLALALPGLSAAQRLRAGVAYAAGGAAAVALLAGPWLAALWREFGNPVFPLMNGWFRSPEALPFNLAAARFGLGGPLDWLAFPFRMITLDRHLYVETFAPDARFAALVLAGAALAVPALRRAQNASALRAADRRVLGFFGLALLAWLATTANGRYGMVVLLLAGVCLARLAERVLAPGAARVALGALLAVQVVCAAVASPPRWFLSEPWTRHWLPYEPPERALREPALYLSVEVLTPSAAAPLLHPQSAFASFSGQISLPGDAPRLAALLERYRGRVRVLGQDLRLADAKLRRLGLRVDPRDCFAIPWRREGADALSRAANRIALSYAAEEPLSLTSCALAAAPRDPADAAAELRASALFDRIERSCRHLLRGQMAVTEPLGAGWSRYYVGLDARLEAAEGRAILSYSRSQVRLDLGALVDWEGGRPPDCAAR